MDQKEFTFTLQKIKFSGKIYRPDAEKAVVIIVHGMGEYFGRYEKFVIPNLISSSFAVVAFDHFGHGKTGGKIGHNPGFEYVLDSIAEAIKQTDQVFRQTPVFLYGHSMGGNAVINYGIRRNHSLTGIISTSPFLKLAFEPPKWKLLLGKGLMRIMPSFTMSNEIDPKSISRDKNEVEAYINDPLIHDKISANYSISFIENGQWAIEHANKLKSPLLLMHGTGDQLTDFKGSKEFSLNNKNVDLVLFEDAFHELHNDIIKDEMMQKIITWINKKL